MNDLTTLYAHARYDRALGHEKVAGILDKLFGLKELTPEQQRVRALVEQSVTDEQLARQKALSKLRAARERLTTNTQPGSATKLLDFARALVPGLSITAAPKDAGITKQSADLPEESVGGRASDVAQALAVLSGAGLGAGIQRGAFGGHRAAEIAARELGKSPNDFVQQVAKQVMTPEVKSIRKALGAAASAPGADAALAMQRNIPVLTRLSDIFSSRAWRARLSGGPRTQAAAAADLATRAGGTPVVRQALEQLRTGMGRAMERAKPKLGWKAGAGIGALALALPLALLKYQQVQALRRRGGTAAASSYREAVEALQRAEKLKQWRQQQLKALPA